MMIMVPFYIKHDGHGASQLIQFISIYVHLFLYIWTGTLLFYRSFKSIFCMFSLCSYYIFNGKIKLNWILIQLIIMLNLILNYPQLTYEGSPYPSPQNPPPPHHSPTDQTPIKTAPSPTATYPTLPSVPTTVPSLTISRSLTTPTSTTTSQRTGQRCTPGTTRRTRSCGTSCAARRRRACWDEARPNEARPNSVGRRHRIRICTWMWRSWTGR